MKTITLEQAKTIKFDRASVALGTFDGLHVGHIALIDAASKHCGDTVAITFDALPVDLFRTHHKPMQLFTMQEKIAAFERTGIDYLCVTHFDKSFAGMGKLDFEKLLVDFFSPVNVIAGYNYTYGHHAQGTADMLARDGALLGYNVEVIPEVLVNEIPVSSTKIRECLWDGQIETANILLGYDYSMSGTVVHGKGIGKTLGFPTANISVAVEKIVPKNGVFSIGVLVGDEMLRGVCSVGVNPTIEKHAQRTIEAHILGFDEDIYDETITVMFKKRIRDEVRFVSFKQLSEQIKKDIEAANIL
jgi:riboflavin kinase/FMN adenylyltransferase